MTEIVKISELSEDDIVEKSNYLVFLKDNPFGITEIKLLDAYLSKINARDDTQTIVRFSKKEFENITGVERIRPEKAKEYTNSLIRPVDIAIPRKKGEEPIYTSIALFDLCSCIKDKDGKYWFELGCSQKAKEYIFNIEHLGYLKYRFGNMSKLTSGYSIYLFLYILANLFKKRWRVSLEELKSKLHCTAAMYNDFKNFNRSVLKKSINELLEKTDLRVEYTPIRERGNKTPVTHIEFCASSTQITIHEQELIDNDYTYNSLAEVVKQTLGIDNKSANAILNKAMEKNVDCDDIVYFAKYTASKPNIVNKTGYMISIIDNPKFQENIKNINLDKNSYGFQFSLFDDTQIAKEMQKIKELEEMEKLFIEEVNKL